MSDLFFRAFEFLKKNPSVLYSFALFIIVPGALFLDVFLAARSFQDTTDLRLQENALTISSVVGTLVPSYLQNPQALENKVQEITQANPSVRTLQVVIPGQNEKFKIIASGNSQEKDKELSNDTSLILAWSKQQALAYVSKDASGERFWNVVSPFQSASDSTSGELIRLSLSLKSTDSLILGIIQRSYAIIFLTTLLVLFLIFQHTRLYAYVFLSQKLQEVDKMKDDFLRMAIHDLQAPIVNVGLYVMSLEEELGSLVNAQQAQYLERAAISVEHLKELVADMLESSRIEQGRIDLTPTKIFPQNMLGEIVEEFRPLAQQSGITLIFQQKEEQYTLWVNKERFREILVNLINNALKYTQEGSIEVGTSVDESRRRYGIFVQDTGVGISAEAQKHLFQKFYRVRTSTTANIQGTGLGLWIVQQLVEKMRGEIYVESIEGRGSKFSVFFPYGTL